MAKTKWTIELATLEAKKYKTIKDFRKNSIMAYRFLNKVDIKYKEIAIAHMQTKNKWTKEIVQKEALKYKTRSEFEKKNKSAYSWIHKYLTETEKNNCFQHMDIKRKSWSKKEIINLLINFKSLKEFRKLENAAYQWTKRNLNKEERDELFSKFKKKEVIKINKNKRYKPTLKEIKEKISKYKEFKIFRKENPNMYKWIYRNLNKKEQYLLYKPLKKTENMNKEKAILLSKEYKTRNNFFRNSPTAYLYLSKKCSKEELNRIYSHMEKAYEITIEEVKETIAKYNTRRDFELNHRGKYSWMHKNLSKQEIEKLCSHMVPGNKGFQPTKPGTLYYLKIQRENFPTVYKIGITNYTIKRRFGSDMKYITIIKEERFEDGSIAAQKELEILRKYKKNKYLGKPILKDGNSELFTSDILGLDI